MGTWDLLHNISGLEDICRWASLHHEKLDGSGYPFAYTAKDLDRNSRLMACLDIYQALIENRPYKAGMEHKEDMKILKRMADMGQLDDNIISDIDECFMNKKQDRISHDTKKEKISDTENAYRCSVCGYVYYGDLPENFIYPQCEQPVSVFEKV